MQELFEIFYQKLSYTNLKFKRFLIEEINWENKLIGITGARGVGKTTMLFQHIEKNLPPVISPSTNVLYASLDDIYFSSNNLVYLADEFIKQGGDILLLDEVHKYPNWSKEIKNIYDRYDNLKVIFTGSSIIELEKGDADLSRRVAKYELPNMSFREFLEFEGIAAISRISLQEIIKDHITIAKDIKERIKKPIKHFKKYIEYGCYPYYKESEIDYHQRIANVINLVLETDLPATSKIKYETIIKIKKFLYVLSQSSPFKPNISKISGLIGTDRNEVISFIDYLHKSRIINTLRSGTKVANYMAKPEMIYFNNPNLIYTYSNNPNIGNVRETFFFNQLSTKHKVSYSLEGDFKVNDHYTFEIGGASKDSRQIRNSSNAYIASDGIEYGIGNKIPLWLFGFLY